MHGVSTSTLLTKRVLATLGLLLVFASALALTTAGPAKAVCQGNGCLPGSGYTLSETWNCGVLATYTGCYYPGTTNINNGITHTWCRSR